MVIGTVLNTLCLLTVTFMTEGKMLREWPKDRVKSYKKYQREVSMIVPWPWIGGDETEAEGKEE